MRLRKVLEIIEGEVISKNVDPNQEIQAGCGGDLTSDILLSARECTLLITELTTPQVVRTAQMADVQAILFVRGKRPWPETIALAEEMDIPLLASKHTMFEACGRLYQAGLPSRYAATAAPPHCREATERECA